MVDYYPGMFPSQSVTDVDFNMIGGDEYMRRFNRGLPPQPSPYNFKILESLQTGPFLVVRVKYPNCATFEGHKILVYEGIDIESLIKQNCIDPHFSESKKIKHPIARFEPNASGWSNAVKLTFMLNSEQLDSPDCPI